VKEVIVCTSSSSRHLVQPLSHGLFPLEVLLVSSSQVLFCFFCLTNADLADFSALTLAAVAASKAVLEALSSASSDEMRALATFRAPEFNKEERKSQVKKQRQACKDKKVLKTRFTFRGLSNFQVLDTLIAQVNKSLHQVLSRK
jgi:hypothetical protein